MTKLIRVPFKNQEPSSYPMLKRRIDMSQVGALILGGGEGKRLFPLTMTRCKPAIPFGGRYRLIDIPMSNSLNSGVNKIYVLTQFLSASLHQHILKTYRIESHTQGFVEILSAEQKPAKKVWYQGTADAIRQNAEYLAECDVEYFLILSGDQLYQMHFEEMLRFAEETEADVVVASVAVDEISAKRMGILKVDALGMIQNFIEKPQSKASLEPLRTPASLLENVKDPSCNYLGSMGIYLFKKEVLLKLLEEDPREDFGKHLIPTMVKKGNAASYVFPGYWEDLGTVDAFYKANMSLTQEKPEFDLTSEAFPLHTTYQPLPPPKFSHSQITASLICEGSLIQAEHISHSIIGPRSTIGRGSVIKSSYLFGNDTYHPPGRVSKERFFSIGEGCTIEKTIIDKHVKIGNNVKLVNQAGYDSYESDGIYIRDGIIVVTRGTTLRDNFVL